MSYDVRVRRLGAALSGLEDVVCALSGGVDSAVLLHAAHAALGERAVGWIGDSPSLPRHELQDARAVAQVIGARVVVVSTGELEVPGYRSNDGARCYFCRRVLFDTMHAWAGAQGFHTIAYGEITDDLQDVRPGRRAATELGIVAPLVEAGFTKNDVRRYANEQGLPVANKPASACLSSRIPMGTPVTRDRLARIERSEATVRSLGFRVLRVRDHGTRARVELGSSELERGQALFQELAAALAEESFEQIELAVYVTPGSQRIDEPPANTVQL